MVVGPYLQYDISDGVTGDFYLLRYADDGRLLSPQTERTLKGKLAGISDVFLFRMAGTTHSPTRQNAIVTSFMGS